jgi:tetratricopeptide (TPR) repeat protein
VTRPGRNDPCPCGSGKKFKKCCLNLGAGPPPSEPAVLSGPTMFEDDIDRLSNQVPALLRQGRYEEAEAVCRRLEAEFPDQPDGVERRAEVEEARGRWGRAAELYRQAANRHLHNDPEYGHEPAERCLEMAQKMDEAKAGGQAAGEPPGGPGG